METIITDLADILKSETNIIAKEKAAVIYLMKLVCFIMSQALERVDDSLVEEHKKQGYQIEKKSERTVVTMLGEITFRRRRYIKKGEKAIYPLDVYMGWTKYSRYSTLVVRNLGELATKLTYRSAEKAVELLASFTISHQKISLLVKEAGENLKIQQTSDQRYDSYEKPKRSPKALYLEGDGFLVKGRGNKWFEVHRFQVCEGVKECGKHRKKRINGRDFVSLDRQIAMKELTDYLGNIYNLKNTIVISNGDGGADYTKNVFEELCGSALRHKFFLDAFHVNKKIKDRLGFLGELHSPLMKAIWHDYDKTRVASLLDTAESMLIDEFDTLRNREDVNK